VTVRPLYELVQTRRVLICVGAGGVGKTTTAAALAVAAAREGKRVLCLTIDPARRLAQALGLDAIETEATEIDPKRFSRGKGGALTVMMLDTKRTFDELVIKYSSTPEKAQKLLSNKLYRYVSTSLAGTQEYMAVEKLVAVKDDPRWDLVVLDTPPTANALDFLDAPERLIDALDSATMKWFVEAFQSTGKVSLNLLAKSAAIVLRSIGKITGGGFLEAMAEFITELNDLFGGFKQRASIVHTTLRGPDVGFVLVTSPNPMSMREVLYFAERLEQHEMPRGAFVVNRFHLPPAGGRVATEEEATAAMRRHGVALEPDAPARLVRAHADHFKLSLLDAAWVGMLEGRDAAVVRIPELASDVHDQELLHTIADALMSGGV
jgi:anion-transporting  ArsA/GET3 family ATPase